ncbi:MAG: hypothetical protein JXA89_21655 [Anaerolineae bacterium]|nr:hypothetical protein [Anaerolineae bacterium]
MNRKRVKCLFCLVLVLMLLASACKSTPEPTAEPATETPQAALPTATLMATATPQVPTHTPEPTATATPTSTPTSTPTPEPVVVAIDVDGGEVVSIDGRAKLVFPPGAVDGPIQVSMTVREATAEDGDVLSPVIEIETDPKLDGPLNVAAVLSLPGLPPGVAALQFARLMTVPGEMLAVEGGESLQELTYWRPLLLTRLDEENAPAVPLVQFSTYAPYSMTLPYGELGTCPLSSPSSGHDGTEPVTATVPVHVCMPPPEMMTPPPAPEGYAYVGTDVVVDSVYQSDLSTVPLTRPGSPQDMVYIDSETRTGDGATQCDIIVAHVFAPLASETSGVARPCEVNPEALEPPDTPAGYRYVGRSVMVNNQIDEGLTTVPPARDSQPTDLVDIRSSSTVSSGATECDMVITHVFEPQPPGTTGTSSGCTPSEAMLNEPQPPASEGYVYLGREVVVNGVYSLEYSTAPLGRPHSPQDVVMISSSTKTSGGVVVCDVIVGHVFAQVDQTGAAQDCVPSWDVLDAPPAPAGYVYVGRDVVINGQWSEQFSTVPLERPESPQEISEVSSHTQVKDGVTICDVIVRHLYAPIGHAGCPMPEEAYAMPPVPPCHRYVGYDVVVNHQLVQTSVPLDRPFSPNDVVQITSYTTAADGVTQCDVIVGHTFEPVPCPPCKTTVQCDFEPYAYNAEAYTELYFSPQSNLPEADKQTLFDLSLRTPYESESGYFSIVLPPGVEVVQEGNQTTIVLPDCE